MLILVNINIFSKKQDCSSLFSTKKKAITMSKVFHFELLIIKLSTLFLHTQKLSFITKSRFIALTLLLTLIKASPDFCYICIRYYIQKMSCSSGLDSKTRSRGLIYVIFNLILDIKIAIIDYSFLPAYQDIYCYNDSSYKSYNTLIG